MHDGEYIYNKTSLPQLIKFGLKDKLGTYYFALTEAERALYSLYIYSQLYSYILNTVNPLFKPGELQPQAGVCLVS